MWYARDLPPIDRLDAAPGPPRIEVLAADGTLLAIHGRDRRAPVPLDALAPHTVQAFLATEDRNFFDHIGINPVAILRAALVNLRHGQVAQGGSTITQQLVKTMLLSPERTWERKAQEAILAVRIDRAYSKEEILGLYLNNVYFGAGAYGIEAAAQRYFGKAAADLGVGESAMLAGLLKAPSRYAPTSDLAAAKKRAGIVLDAMVDAGFLTAGQKDAVLTAGIAGIVIREESGAYAADAAVEEAARLLGGFGRSVTITTTIDAAATEAAMRALSEEMDADGRLQAAEAALLIAEETGAVRVLIGGRDHARSAFNRATKAKRQPGSVFKPFVYLAAIESGWRPEDRLEDAPVEIDGYAPGNYKDRYYGEVPLSEALSRSLNAAVLRLQEAVGRDRVISAARRAGLDGVRDVGPSLAFGVTSHTPMEVLTAYGTLSAGGKSFPPYLVESIGTDRGQTLWRRRPPAGEAVFEPQHVAALSHMLRSVVARGSGVHARLPGHEAAGKTGTAQDSRDAWFAGYASGVVGVVWMGHDDNSPMAGAGGVSGSGAPARVWQRAMTAALEGRPARPPLPYTPPAPERSLLDHLAGLLGLDGEGEAEAEAPADPLGGLIDEVSG